MELILIISWIVLSIIIGVVGSSRKIGFLGGFFLSLLLSPLIGIIITVSSKTNDAIRYEKEILETQKKQHETLEQIKSQNVSSIADDLKKIKELLLNSVITEEEFEKMKKKIISNLEENSNKKDENILLPLEETIGSTHYEKTQSRVPHFKRFLIEYSVLIILILIISFNFIFGREDVSTKTISYTEFENYIDTKSVDKITIITNKNLVRGDICKDSLTAVFNKDELKNPEKGSVESNIPSVDQVSKMIKEKGFLGEVKYAEDNNILKTIIIPFGSIIMLVFLWLYPTRKMESRKNKKSMR